MDKRIFNHTSHKEMWKWLSNNPIKQKKDWIGWDHNGGDLVYEGYDCFACEYCKTVCDKCPLDWPDNDDGDRRCDGIGGIWYEWVGCKDMEIRSNLAKQIAEVPLRADLDIETI